MMVPRIEGEDQSKVIDFTGRGISARWQAGYDDTKRAIVAKPWSQPVDAKDGLVIHDFESKAV
jgi:NTE family protein